MILLKLALRNLGRSKRTGIVLISLVAVGVFLFVLGDALLASAASGIKGEFQNAYTGDIAIRAKFERKFGVFGFSMPTIGEYEVIPVLPEEPAIKSALSSVSGIECCAALVSGAALLQGPQGYEIKVPVFGVNAGEYFRLFPQLKFVRGTVPPPSVVQDADKNDAWIVLPESRAEEIGKSENRQLEIGDTLQFTMAAGNAFTIRAVRLAGIVETPGRGNEETAAVYTNPSTLRALLGLSLGSEEKAAPQQQPDETSPESGGSLDSFFDTPDEAISARNSGPSGIDLMNSYLEKQGTSLKIDPEKGAWHFVLARLKPGAGEAATLAAVNRVLKQKRLAAEAVNWLSVAGLNANLLYLLKTLFEIGIGVLAAIVVLVLTNGLAFAVMEQTREIGTMRAMGAQRSFVAGLYFLQSLAIVLIGTAAGAGLGCLALAGIGRVGIPITNSYLFMLFGVNLLKPALSISSLVYSLIGAVAVAAVASFYPIQLAARMTVAETMEAE